MKRVLAVLGVATTIALAASSAHAGPFVTGQTRFQQAYPPRPVYTDPAPTFYNTPRPVPYYPSVAAQDSLWLPRWHRYEVYNPESASYGSVRVETVPSYVRQGAWIYDRTEGVWVSHPSVGQPNPRYVASGPDFPVQDSLRLPRRHRYEVYNPESASYGAVRIDTVPGYVRQGAWIYDRTAGDWVSHPSVGQPNPRYVASGYDFRR